MRTSISYLFLGVFVLVSLYSFSCQVAGNRAQVASLVQLRAMKDIVEHHSFSPPILHNYYVGGELPFWSIGGSTVVTDDYVRLTPDGLHEVGSLWNRPPLTMPSFDIIMGVCMLKKNAGDGMALWVIQEGADAVRPVLDKVHGHNPLFTGFGIILDTFDNNGLRDNPTVGLLYNNGDPKKVFDPDSDYIKDYVASCVFDFRSPNKKYFSSVRVHVTRGTVSVFLSKPQSQEEVHCFTVDDLFIDVKAHNYHIGITATTGGLSQEHDVIFLHTLPLQNVQYDHDVHVAQKEPETPEVDETSSESNKSAKENDTPPEDSSKNDEATQERVRELERELERLRKLARKSEEESGNGN